MGLRVGVIGTGRLGREHVRVLCGLEQVSFVACHDQVVERARGAANEFGATACERVSDLLSAVDAVSVVVPTTRHADFVMAALEMGKDVFVEKPIADGVEAAGRIVDCARRNGRILQVGHVERFNGAVEKAVPRIGSPSFIEIHRLAPFSVRGTDVSVVGDLMIHDLDLLFFMMGEPPCDVRAKGAGVLTAGPDIVNARLEYRGGCVANVTASRITVEPMRKLRVFWDNGYVSIDLLKGIATEYRKAPDFEKRIARLRSGAEGGERLQLGDFIEFQSFVSDGVEPLKKELEAFCRSVLTREPPPVTGEDGLNALRLASQIVDIIRGEATV